MASNIVRMKTDCGKDVKVDLNNCFKEKEAPDGIYVAHPEECDGPEIFLYEKKNNKWINNIRDGLIVCEAEELKDPQMICIVCSKELQECFPYRSPPLPVRNINGGLTFRIDPAFGSKFDESEGSFFGVICDKCIEKNRSKISTFRYIKEIKSRWENCESGDYSKNYTFFDNIEKPVLDYHLKELDSLFIRFWEENKHHVNGEEYKISSLLGRDMIVKIINSGMVKSSK